MEPHRQLAAILFTDIQGYPALVQKDEQQALALRERHREILQSEHRQHYGRIMQHFGDSTLSIFASAVEAVRCALAMQLAFRREPRVPVRMGLHIGDVIIGDDVIGDGVNLASRIQSLGVAGSVLLSDKVRDEIQNHPDLPTVSMGTYQLKNISRLVEVFALNHDELVVPAPQSLKGKTADQHVPASVPPKSLADIRQALAKKVNRPLQHSIAVLPFVNMSNDPEQEYFSDGMTEEILNSLTQIKDLHVAGRTSSFRFKGQSLDLREVGDKLHVETVLEGSVRKQGNRVRITAQLVDVEDGYHLWSERYDREMDDIFAIQDDISAQIAEQLKVNFFGSKRPGQDVKKPTTHLAAYDEYLKGRYWLENTVAGIPRAMEHFKQAVKLDPAFAAGWCSLGVVYFQALVYMFVSNKEGMEKSKKYAEKAIALDPQNGEAHILLAQVYLYYNLDWERAGTELAISKKNTCNASIVKFLPFEPWYRGMIFGDFDFSIRYLQEAVAQDPLSIYFLQHLSYLYLFGKRNYPEAREVLKRIFDIDPLESEAWRTLAHSYLFDGENDLALVFARKAYELAQGRGLTVFTLITCLAATGQKKEANKLYENLAENIPGGHVPAVHHCFINLCFGNLDAACGWLEKAFAEHDFWLFTLKYSPEWDPMRQEPRFQKVLEQMHFPG